MSSYQPTASFPFMALGSRLTQHTRSSIVESGVEMDPARSVIKST